MKINMLEAKNRLSELVKSAQAGEEVVIANRGEPVARLVPVRSSGRYFVRDGDGALSACARAVAHREGIVAWLERHPLPAHVRRSAQAIDASIADERAAWD